MASLEDLFKAIDRDGSGALDLEEIRAHLTRGSSPPTPEEAARRVEHLEGRHARRGGAAQPSTAGQP